MAERTPLATTQDLADWIGETIDVNTPEEKRAALCLRAASALVRKEAGQTWLDPDTGELLDVPDEAFTVTLYCAARVYTNMEAQTSSGIDDAQDRWKVDEAGAYLTASEKRTLADLRPSTGGIGTVGTYRGRYVTPAGYVPTDTPDVEFPWY